MAHCKTKCLNRRSCFDLLAVKKKGFQKASYFNAMASQASSFNAEANSFSTVAIALMFTSKLCHDEMNTI